MPANNRFALTQTFEGYTDYDANSDTDIVRRVTFVAGEQPYLTMRDFSEKRISLDEANQLIKEVSNAS